MLFIDPGFSTHPNRLDRGIDCVLVLKGENLLAVDQMGLEWWFESLLYKQLAGGGGGLGGLHKKWIFIKEVINNDPPSNKFESIQTRSEAVRA